VTLFFVLVGAATDEKLNIQQQQQQNALADSQTNISHFHIHNVYTHIYIHIVIHAYIHKLSRQTDRQTDINMYGLSASTVDHTQLSSSAKKT